MIETSYDEVTTRQTCGEPERRALLLWNKSCRSPRPRNIYSSPYSLFPLQELPPVKASDSRALQIVMDCELLVALQTELRQSTNTQERPNLEPFTVPTSAHVVSALDAIATILDSQAHGEAIASSLRLDHKCSETDMTVACAGQRGSGKAPAELLETLEHRRGISKYRLSPPQGRGACRATILEILGNGLHPPTYNLYISFKALLSSMLELSGKP